MANKTRITWYWHNNHQKHADVSPKVGIRVQEGGPGFEWSVWVGAWRARVMHASGYTRTRLGAERAAVREGRKLAAVTAYTCAACVRVPHDTCGMESGCLCCARTAEAIALEGGAQ